MLVILEYGGTWIMQAFICHFFQRGLWIFMDFSTVLEHLLFKKYDLFGPNWGKRQPEGSFSDKAPGLRNSDSNIGFFKDIHGFALVC